MKKLGILIPAYNEENRLPVSEYYAFLEQLGNLEYTLIFLNDGSSDATLDLLRTMQVKYPNHILIEDYPNNEGKAAVVRKGMLQYQSQFEYLGYLDADLATSLDEFVRIYLRANKEDKKICFGSRIKKLGSQIDRTSKRHVLGRIFATLANYIIKVPIYDTQCGAKLFNHSLVNELFQEPFISKWLFDIEIISRVINQKGRSFLDKNAIEVPLKRWQEKGDSKIKLKDFFSFPIELWKIGRKYK